MALGRNDAQSAQGGDVLMVDLPLRLQCRNVLLFGGIVQTFVMAHCVQCLVDIAAQHNVGAPPRHVGGDGDHLGAPGLGHDVRFTGVLLGVEHLVR